VSAERFERLLRWYPPTWRVRYGEELVALMEDTYGGDKVPLRAWLGIVRAGIFEHVSEMGLGSGDRAPGEQVRAGSLLVLCAWTLFVVAGAGFAKFAEHWDAATPRGDRWLPAGAYDTVQWAAGIGALIVLVAAAATLPAVARFVRDGSWRQVRRPVCRAVFVASTTGFLSAGVIAWAHHIGPRQRTDGSWPYEVVGVLWAVMIAATIATCTVATVAAARRLRLTPRVLGLEGGLALLLTATMIAVFGGTLVWWGAIATDAPRFLSGTTSGLVGNPAPLAMIIPGFLMLAGLGIAVAGVGRVARSIRAIPAD
jgi:hypothetical protein